MPILELFPKPAQSSDPTETATGAPPPPGVPENQTAAGRAPGPTRLKLRTGRFGELEEHELIHLIDSLDDERSRARFRESIYISVIIWIAIGWFLFYGPRVLFHVPQYRDPIALMKQHDQELTLNLPPAPHVPRVQPKIDNKTMEQLKKMEELQRLAHPAPPTPQPPAPQPEQQPPPQQEAHNTAPPVPQPAMPLPAAPKPSPSSRAGAARRAPAQHRRQLAVARRRHPQRSARRHGPQRRRRCLAQHGRPAWRRRAGPLRYPGRRFLRLPAPSVERHQAQLDAADSAGGGAAHHEAGHHLDPLHHPARRRNRRHDARRPLR